MKVIINGNNFKIYDLDNIITFKERYSAEKKTLPRFLVFEKKVTAQDLVENKKFKVKNFLRSIKKSAKNNKSVLKLLKKLPLRVSKDNTISLWLYYNTKLNERYAQQGKESLTSIAKELQENKYILVENQLNILWNNRDNSKKDIDEEIRSILTRSTNQLKILQSFGLDEEGNYNPKEIGYASSPIEVESVMLSLSLNSKLSLDKLFNSIILNTQVPFAKLYKVQTAVSPENGTSFYKILKDFIPTEEWININLGTTTKNNFNDFLLIKVDKSERPIGFQNIPKNYGTIIFNKQENNVRVHFSIETEKISRKEYIQRGLGIFKSLDLENSGTEDKMTEDGVTGIFYYPQKKFNKYIFSDLVLNDPVFSLLLNIDDHDKATKKKSGLYIHFNHILTGNITATITSKIRTANDISFKSIYKEYFPVGESYIRVRISRARNKKDMEKFKFFLDVLLYRYDNKFDEIVAFYQQYSSICTIPSFKTVEIEEEKKISTKLIDLAPEVFVQNYTRNCKQDRNPILISETKAQELKSADKSVIKFPRDSPIDDKQNPLPTDGKNQHYYTCTHPNFKYIGLKKNNLKNSQQFPYIPCCFRVDQRKKDNFLHYYEGKKPLKKTRSKFGIHYYNQ